MGTVVAPQTTKAPARNAGGFFCVCAACTAQAAGFLGVGAVAERKAKLDCFAHQGNGFNQFFLF